jgi:hypothetical protein
MLSVICLVLFTAQLSYKFYLFASVPAFTNGDEIISHKSRAISHKGETISRETGNPGNPGTPNYHGKVRLLLDKRYEQKHIFVLLAPTVGVDHLPLNGKREFYYCPESNLSNSPLTTSLRGPPAFQA